MRTKILTTVAAILLVTLYVVAPEIGKLCVFLAIFTGSILRLTGLIGKPAAVRQSLREAAVQAATPTPKRVPDREFLYPRFHWAAKGLLWLLGLFQSSIGLAMLFGATGDLGLRIGVSALPLLGAGIMFWLAIRIPRMQVRIGAEGIESRQLLGTYRIAWDEIVVVSKIDYLMRGQYHSSAHKVYSKTTTITIGDRLLGYNELLEIINENRPETVVHGQAA
ncbi:MAG: PH domain-containing protein [Planctomycetota bacterium]|nr:PH domain-containing protein [Planctomycetota bacterium]